MRDRRENDGRVSKRSSTGIRRDSTAEKREPIRSFEEADDIYRDAGRRGALTERRPERRDDRYDDRRDDRYDDRRDDRHERRRNDRYDDRRDDRYDDRRDDRYDDRRDDRYDDRRDDRYDDRRDDRYDDRRDDRYDDRRNGYRDDRDAPRRSRRETPKWGEYRFDEEEEPRRRQDRLEEREVRRAPRNTRAVRRGGTRRVGGDTELFVHQIVPYAMFWIALFAAVSFILRDFVAPDGSMGAFGSWLANAMGGLMGPVAYLLPFWLVVLALRWKTYVRQGNLFKKLILSAAFLWLLAGIVHVFADGALRSTMNTEGLYASGALLQSGGLLGGYLGEWLGYMLYRWGTILLAIPLLLIIGIYLIGMTPGGIWQRISCKMKMSAGRRAARRRALYSGEEARTLRFKNEREAAERAEESDENDTPVDYEFSGDDEEFSIERPRRSENKMKTEEPASQSEAARMTETESELLDIPGDLPDAEEPADDLRAILDRAGHAESAEDKLEQILREAAERSEREAVRPEPVAVPEPVEVPEPLAAEPVAVPEPVVTPEPVAEPEEERPLQGSSYSPFALHRHFESEPPSAAFASATAPAAEEKAVSRLTEEPLGAYRPTVAATPVAEESLGSPYATRPAVQEPVVQESAPVEVERPAAMSVAEEVYTTSLADALIIENPPAPVAVAEPVVEPVAVPTVEPTIEEPVSEIEVEIAPVAAQPVDVVERLNANLQSSFGFADDDEEEPTPVAVPFVREEVPAAPAVPPARPAAPAPQTVPMRPKAQVLTKVESVKEEKPVPPPPPREYRLPHIDLLKEDTSIKENDHSEEIQEKIDVLRTTLKSFNIRVKDEVSCSRGPTITRYELRPEPGVSVRSVMNRADDISLNMAAPVRIEAPIPGKPAIGIEVPNTEREMVFMRTLLESDLYKNSKKPLEVPLGLDVGGDIIMCDLAKMPHLLVAGSTGSGKSVCINTILISLMYKTTPNDLRLILIDPKQVEFTSYNHIPHLYAPIVTDPARAVGVLACAVQEMERRYSLIKDVGVRNIEGYNEVTKNDPEREHLPYMVIVIDEFADLKMACSNNDVEAFTCRLAQKARAAGMHLIIGTQRPTVNVITGNLKNNIPSRIAFKVTQQTDSRTILDANGAEQLIGRGDMLYMTAGLPKPARMQGAFVSDEEVERVASFVRDHNDDVQYNQAFMDQIEAELARSANTGKDDDPDSFDDGDDEDPKFREAVALAIETQKVATSLLQRRLGVGYGRAAKIIDRMEALGYVSAPDGNKPRKVLITHAQFAADMMDGEDGDMY